MAYDPATGAMELIRDRNGAPISSGVSTDTEKATQDIQNRLKAITATGAQSRETQQAGHMNELAEIVARAVQERLTQQSPRSAAPRTPNEPTATQETEARLSKAEEFAARNTDLSQYITVDRGSKTVQIRPPGGFRGPSQEQYNKMVNGIYGSMSASPAAVPPSGGATTVPQGGEDLSKKPPPAGMKPGGRWRMTSVGPVYNEP